MSLSKSTLTTATALVVFAIAGCGAPSIQTMHPQVKKQAAAVFLLNNPSFASAKTINLQATDGTNVTEVSAVTTNSFTSALTKVLGETGITTVVVAGDNLQGVQPQLEHVISTHPNLHVDLVSNSSLTIPAASNLQVVTQDEHAVSYALGWLTGVFANTEVQTMKLTQQPSIGFYAGKAPNNDKKAFFAGLYTADPVARVISMSPLNGPKATSPIYPTVSLAVFGSQPPQALLNQVNITQPAIVTLTNTTGLSVPIGLKPGEMTSSHLQNMLSQFGRGQWKNGTETVVDKTSVNINTQVMPKQVKSAWTSIQSTLTAKPSTWQQAYSKLPASTRQKIQSQFGVQ